MRIVSSEIAWYLTEVTYDPAKFEKLKNANNLLILNMSDNVLRKVKHSETATDM